MQLSNPHRILFATLALAAAASLSHAQDETYTPSGYRIETIALPADTRFEIAGLDIDKTGTVYCATRIGDIWANNGQSWSKFADGLHEPCGVLCEDDGSIVVAQKPELTRLVDRDQDGTADDYISLTSAWEFHDNYHEFHFGPVKDSQGNYYGTLNLSHKDPNALSFGVMGSAGGLRGYAYRLTPKGKFQTWANGLRSPAGLGISPQGDIFFTDNQGDWVASSKLHLLKKDAFYGHPVSLRDTPDFTPKRILSEPIETFDAMREIPNLWIPHKEVGNSPGNPEWDTTQGKFGPFAGQIFIGDQTQSNVFRATLEKINGQYQGMVINFINGFQCGNIRLRFDPQGRLWTGQTSRGWNAQGGEPFGLQRVVWDGSTTPFELLDMKLSKTGFTLSFTQPLDPASVSSASLKFQSWSYAYHSKYGSPKLDLTEVPSTNITLSEDRKSLLVTLPLKTGKIYSVDFDSLRSSDAAAPSVSTAYYTLNNLLR